METPEPLPNFKYHSDPIATGSVEPSESPCLRCNRIRGYIYTGPAYSEKFHYLTNSICPWCIADGTAAKQFGATFTDGGTMEDVSPKIIDEVETRTPGFTAWQQEVWLTCCNDAMAFLGPVGARELKSKYPEAIPIIKGYLADEHELSAKEVEKFFESLSRENEPTAYLFRCLHCHNYLAYTDMT